MDFKIGEMINCPDLLVELLDLFVRTLSESGGGDEVKAERLVLAFCREFGGQQVYVPSLRVIGLAQRDRLIFDKYSRGNTNSLAREFGLTESRIYEIVKKQREHLSRCSSG